MAKQKKKQKKPAKSAARKRVAKRPGKKAMKPAAKAPAPTQPLAPTPIPANITFKIDGTPILPGSNAQ